MHGTDVTQGDFGRGRAWVAAALLVAACGRPAGLADGQWTGDLTQGDTASRLQVTVDSGGRVIRVTAAAWRLQDAAATPATMRGDSTGFTLVAGSDTVVFRGAVAGETVSGSARRGSEHRRFEVRRLSTLADGEWGAVFGTYRGPNGALIGVSRFDEFGPTPQVIDFHSGRIGPLFPIDPRTFLVGRSLVAPIFPADTLCLLPDEAGGGVTGIRLVARGQPPLEAERVAARDEGVTFSNGDVRLSGTLTLPAESPPYPAIVIVHGSGPLTRDHLAPWQRFFPGLGYAVLSYDKRGTGRSTGDWRQADFTALAGDVLAAARLLAARPDIRRDRIGLWGISQGGWILPLAVSIDPADIAFLIVHAGTGTTVREQGILNLQYEYRFRGASEAEIAVATQYRMIDDSVTRTGRGWDRLQRFYAEHHEQAPLSEPAPLDSWFRPYYRMLMDFDPAESWARVKIPVLLFFGELDANVPPTESWPPIERALRRAGNSRVTHYVLPMANHLLLAARTGARDEYPRLSRFVPGYFDRMAKWLTSWSPRRVD
jgi:alpha-beta hydrolase superfamily lysophospholipase